MSLTPACQTSLLGWQLSGDLENLFLQQLSDGNLRGNKKKKNKTPLGREKTLMNHLSKLLPNPLAGFVCTHVRMSISRREVEVSGGKISAESKTLSPALCVTEPGLTPAGLLSCCSAQLPGCSASPEHGEESQNPP